MKTTITLKQIAFAIIMVLSISACKKDKNGPTPTPPVEIKAITITELKGLSTAASVKIPDARTVKGIVISHTAGKNIDGKTLVLQEATGKPGIVVTLDAANTFAAGDELELTVSNQTLAQLNGEVVLQNIPLANVKKTGTGTIVPAETNIAVIVAAKANFDGTLVKIAATELTGGDGKYTGTLNIKDATGTVTSVILPAASFSETEYPASVSSITGIVRVNGDQTRIDIRKTDEVVIGSVLKVITENFENITALITGSTDASEITNNGFKTKAGIEWYDYLGYSGVVPVKDGNGDASFTIAGKTYIYLIGNGYGSFNGNNGALGFKAPIAKGLKSVSITFAQSKLAQLPYNGGTLPANSFNPSTDYLQIMVLPKIGTPGSDAQGFGDWEKLRGLSEKYTVAGNFVTYTWKIPTKEELIAMGATEAEANNFIERPSFSIYNMSKTTGGNEISVMLFDKIVLNYGN